MSIQSNINQALGATAIAARLSPQLQEFGDKIRTNTESARVESQLKKIASKGYVDFDPKTYDRYTILDYDENMFKYLALVEKKKMLDKKKSNLGLKPTYWKGISPNVLTLDEAAELESIGELQRVKVEKIKEVRNKIRDSQFGGKNYGNDKQ